MSAPAVDRVLEMRLDRVQIGAAVPLRDVAIEVSRGEIVGVAGRVGAGKTTLALTAAGLLGRSLPGRVVGHVSHRAGGDPPAAFVFANPWTQLTELGGTVEEEVAVGPENLALPPPIIRERVDASLALARAAAFAGREPRHLSGGELQRVALASALALDAPLLVLDEPTAQLDAAGTRELAAALRALAARGHGILLVEQKLELLVELASRVLVLADGRPLAIGDPADLLDRWPPLDPGLGATPDATARGAPPRAPVAPGPPLLELRDLVAGYPGREVLHGLSLGIPAGIAAAWLGPNGAGKTTLARTIMGLVPTRAGSVRVGGIDLDGLPVEERAQHVGLVFQDPGRQLFARTVLEEALFAPRALGHPAAQGLASAREALAVVGLAESERMHPGDLPPQAQRRLAIAAALAARPQLLILDEPTAGQDAAGRAWIAGALEAQRTRGGAAAVITHDLGFARRYCDVAVTIAGGKVSSEGIAPEGPAGAPQHQAPPEPH